jgi:outer membrane protein OmpA-like peptidoglycan-associated protein
MTAPHPTPNPGTVQAPERSSRRVVRKSPLAWLPRALLAAIALLVGLLLLAYNAVDDDGPEGPAGDALGQVSDSDRDSAAGSDGSSDDGGEDGERDGGSPEALAALTSRSLVGGGAVPAAALTQTAGAEGLARQPGTAGTVLFDVGSAEIGPEGMEVVAAAAAALKEVGAQQVTVVGHTDVVAGDPTNDPLSQQRADAVARALGEQLPGVQIRTAARGQEEPVADNATEQGRQLNRRAVITATA